MPYEPIMLRAKYRTSCTCGRWVSPGETILWDPERRRTVGCKPDGFTGEDPSGEWGGRGLDPEDFPIFHE